MGFDVSKIRKKMIDERLCDSQLARIISVLQIQLTSLDSLPLEILLQVLRFARFRDKLSLSQTCKRLNHVSKLSIYREIRLIPRGYKCLDAYVSCCYDWGKLDDDYKVYIEKLYNFHTDPENPYTVIYGDDKLVNLRNNYASEKLHYIELEQDIKLPRLNSLRKLKIQNHGQRLSLCVSANQDILEDQLEELDIDDPVILSRLSLRFNNLKRLRLSINQITDFGELWGLLAEFIPIEQLKSFQINFKSSLNLSSNPYLINVESLQYLERINEFLQRLAVELESIEEVCLIVEDQRKRNNIFKKIQPDLNQFLVLLPKKLNKVVIKLSNEFSISQFQIFFKHHPELKEFVFIGNLGPQYLGLENNLKVNMLQDGILIKDYTMYGKFFKEDTSSTSLQLQKELQQLSKRSSLDYLNHSSLVVDSMNYTLIRDLLQNNLDCLMRNGEFSHNMTDITLNGLSFQLKPNGIVCISD